MKTSRGVRTLAGIGAGALVVAGSRMLLNFFGPQPEYALTSPMEAPLDSDEFVQFLSLVTNGTRRCSRLRRLRNGDEFFPAMLEAIGRAKHAINLEMYEFLTGRVADDFLGALAERASHGVEVRVVVDAIGSFGTPDALFDSLRDAGGQMCWYHPIRWDTWQKVNQRTHRKLLVIDGHTAFIGGAGIGDDWLYPSAKGPAWRDTMFCVEGEAVAGLISTFCENWLESSGEILSGTRQFGFRAMPEGSDSFVVSSTPRGGGTGARILFQALIKCARQRIQITTPYFLPDRSARHALVEAVQRGVEVQIITAGPHIDHPYIRTLSRHSSRHLVRGGASIFEYQPSMIHAKLMTVDGMWAVVGSTNFDHRSFALNDEVNLAVLDAELVAVMERDFAADLENSQRLTLSMLRDGTPLGELGDPVIEALESES